MHYNTHNPKQNQMHYVKFAVAIILAVFTALHPSAQVSIATWNLKNLGGSKDQAELTTIAQNLRDHDIVLIQEVVAKDPAGAQTVAKLEAILDRMGAEWDSQVSYPTRSPSAHISERYAILWKPSSAKLIGHPRLVSERAAEIDREPFEATFQADGMTFTVLNLHARPYNKQPEREIKALITYILDHDDITYILAGDFNLTEDHTVWHPLLRNGYTATLDDQPTTLKKECKDGSYLNHAIDNIFYPKEVFTATNSGVIDHVGSCANLTYARGVSDHMGVFVRLEGED
jgi:endonuclease/exonuclease/phosphatase family metal-dependent hydrolase